jgi:hypothetical protein
LKTATKILFGNRNEKRTATKVFILKRQRKGNRNEKKTGKSKVLWYYSRKTVITAKTAPEGFSNHKGHKVHKENRPILRFFFAFFVAFVVMFGYGKILLSRLAVISVAQIFFRCGSPFVAVSFSL